MKNKKIIYRPRSYGKNTEGMMVFLNRGKKGEVMVFRTPEGDFLSPKAVEKALEKQKSDFIKEIKGMKKNKFPFKERPTRWDERIEREWEHYLMDCGYNQSIDDISNKMKGEKQ